MIGAGDGGEPLVGSPDDTAGSPTPDRWRPVRRTAYGVFFAVLVWVVIRDGVPTSRITLALIIMTGLAFWVSGQFFLTRAYTLLVFAGIWALMKGITDIVRAFQIRRLAA